MSIRLLNYVFDAPIKNPVQKLILLVLADNSDEEGWCFPSVRTIMRKTSLSDTAVRDNIRLMAASGLIKRQACVTDAEGRNTSNNYLIITPDTPNDTPPPARRGIAAVSSEIPPSYRGTPPATPRDLNHKVSTTEPTSSSSNGVATPPQEEAITPTALKYLWNTLVPSLNKIEDITGKRLKAAKACGDIQRLTTCFKMIEASDFLAGREQRDSHKNWKPTLDWALNPTNFTKIIEGNYTNKPTQTAPNRRSDSANAPGRYD